MHILTKSDSEEEEIFHFGAGLTGHHGKISDLTFVGGRERKARHIASVSGLFLPTEYNIYSLELTFVILSYRRQKYDRVGFVSS